MPSTDKAHQETIGKPNFIKEWDSTHAKMVTTYRDEVPKEFIPTRFGEDRDRPLYVYNSGKEDMHRVEFINWKAYWICNVEINGVWHTNSYPNGMSMIEFLAEGQINRAKQWPVGRNYTHNE